MRYKVGRTWSANDPRHVGAGEVAWNPSINGPSIGGGRRSSHVGADPVNFNDNWEPRELDINQQETLANLSSSGVE